MLHAYIWGIKKIGKKPKGFFKLQIDFPIPGFIIHWCSKKLEVTNFHPEEKQDLANSTTCSQSPPWHFGRERLCLWQHVAWSHRRGLAEWKSWCWGPKDHAVGALWFLPQTRLQSVAMNLMPIIIAVHKVCWISRSVAPENDQICMFRDHTVTKWHFSRMLRWAISKTHSCSKL